MVSAVTWEQLSVLVGIMLAVFGVGFWVLWNRSSASVATVLEAEEKLTSAIMDLAKVVKDFQLEVAKERASNSYVEEVKKELTEEVRDIWGQVNRIRDAQVRGPMAGE